MYVLKTKQIIMKNKIIFLFVFLSLVLSACKKEFLKPTDLLFPNTNVYNVKFKPRMTNSSTKLIAWGNITLSDIQNGWYLPVNYWPDGRYGIYHFN